MGNFSIQTEGSKTFLAYTVEPDDEIDSISLGMLTNNRIAGLAETIFGQMDAQRYIRYNVSSKVALSQIFSGVVTRRRLLAVFLGILDALTSAEEYMIDIDSIMLDLEYIFMDISSDSTVLICVPVRGMYRPTDVGMFFKSIMFNTQFDFSENCDYVAKIINYLNGAKTIDTADFKRVLLEIQKSPQRAPAVWSEQPAPSHAVRPVPDPPAVPAAAAVPPHSPAPVAAGEPPVGVPVRGEAARTVQTQLAPPEAQPSPEVDEKKISMLYLLRHYSKENADLYKAQQQKSKDAKRDGGAAVGKKAKAEKKGKAPKAKKADPSAAGVGFAMPGQDASAQPAPAIQRTPEAQPAPQPISVSRPTPTAPPIPVAPIMESVQLRGVERALPVEETSFLNESEETVIMGHEQAGQRLTPHLIRRKNNERIPVDKEVFRLGRDAEFNDYALIDNRFVGHSHCHIVTRDGEYFIVDDNSKNHTKVNGTQIVPGTEVKLAHDYVVSVADEDFEFRLF